MIKAEAKKRIQKLKVLINKHRYLYHVKDAQEISDEAFDGLKHELFELEQQFPELITPDSPTQRVGGEPLEKFQKVPHPIPMLSIEDIFEEKEFSQWEEYLLRLLAQKQLTIDNLQLTARRKHQMSNVKCQMSNVKCQMSVIEYFGELKVDGFAVALRYQNGVFETGATRGNGQVGENVTQNLKTIESIPLKLELHESLSLTKGTPLIRLREALEKGTVEVRGEVYMSKKDFEKFNKERAKQGEEPYANPRNLAAGSIRQLDPKLAASRPLGFVAYALLGEFGQTTHAQEHEMLAALGFKTDPTARICKDKAAAIAYWKDIEKKRNSLPFQVDGVVMSVNENRVFQSLGVAGKSPRGVRALKFSGKQASTQVLDVRFQVGRTGAVTPVAVLKPVQLGGVTVSRATLHNQDEIKRLGVKIGDTVIVERAGDVIPAVVKVLPELRVGSEKPITMPSHCPVCGKKLQRPSGEVVWRCTNKDCQAQKREFLYHFVSRKAFDIQGLGPKILDKLVEEHLVSESSDIFELEEGDLAPLERFAEKSAQNIVSAIGKAKEIPLSRFLYSLGIRHVGEETALDLVNHFGSLKGLQKASREELEEVEDIGSVVAQSIYEWFQEKQNQKLVKGLLEVGVKILEPKASKKRVKSGISGKTFVLTGSLEKFSRDEAKSKIREFGGNVSESVSKKTDYVIAGENPGSKLDDAKRLGVKILSEKEFLRLLQT